MNRPFPFFLFLFLFFFNLSGNAQQLDWLCFTAEEDGSSVSIKSLIYKHYVEYSLDGGKSWTERPGTIKLNSKGDKVYFRGMLPKGEEPKSGLRFYMTGLISASGNIMTIFDTTQYLTSTPFDGCLSYAFSGCTSLLTPPDLPAEVLTKNCYSSMFSGCTNLRKAPELPAEVLADGCYSSMFAQCGSLQDAPVLPAEVLAKSCYSSMFSGCTDLQKAPELPAEVLADGCYSGMFENCSNLVVASELPAKNLAKGCYKKMFYNCKKLDSLSVAFESFTREDLTDWLDGVSVNGFFHCPANMAKKCSVYIPSGWYFTAEKDLGNCLCCTNCKEITFNNYGDNTPVVLCSSDYGTTWDTLTGGTHKFNVRRVYLRGDNPSGFSSSRENYTVLSIDGDSVTGNVMSLLGESVSDLEIPSDYCFYSLFSGSEADFSLNLPATVLTKGCYELMFDGAFNLKKAPKLPAVELKPNCYSGMFSYCGNLQKAPELPAEVLADSCYSRMFFCCTDLQDAPVLPAEILAKSCYSSMFSGCTDLQKAPELLAEVLADGCYSSMFAECRNLQEAPVLPEPQVLPNCCFSNMFYGCESLSGYPEHIMKRIMCFTAEEAGSSFSIITNRWYYGEINYSLDGGKTWQLLTETPVVLENVGDKAYLIGRNEDLTNITLGENFKNEPKVQFSISGAIAATGNISSIFDQCATVLYDAPAIEQLFKNCEGLTKAPELPMDKLRAGAYNRLFEGCINLRECPDLPAKQLADGCYYGMFMDCKSLTKACFLPATNLAPNCYSRMFQGCESLKYLKVAFESWTNSTNATLYWVEEVPEGGLFEGPDSLDLVYGGSRIPIGWGVNETANSSDYRMGNTHVFNVGTVLFIEGANENVMVYDSMGRLEYFSMPTSEDLKIDLKKGGVYVIRIGNKRKKILVGA